ncbi:MAG TPA: M48 family metallopeptidase [Candidatus Acidoferrum sp.]|nr:M48 family metallopeptidase [Candidatus Acidoferrum sp.]
MKRLALVLSAPAFVLALALYSTPLTARGQQSSTPAAAAQQQPPPGAAPAAWPQEASKIVTAYTLPPDLARKAHHRAEIEFWGQIAVFFYSILILLLILKWKLAPTYRNWAEKATCVRFLQALIFAPLILLTIAVLESPGDIAEQWVERKFGLSIQGWGSWSWDWIKTELITMLIGAIVIWILYAIIRKSPRRWWFYFWLIVLPIIVFLIFLQPVVFDPLFHKFEPLQAKDPALTASLEQMVQRAGENIPPERMFWMGASEKSTELNAYVTGVGASKRIVVWDTTIAKMNTPQIVFVAGHEMGHYVLLHIPKDLALLSIVFLVLFYLGYRSIGWTLAQGGTKWEVRDLGDWASFPALLLLLTIFTFIANPLTSMISRHFEHQADQYGLEVTHGLTPDSGEVAAQAFQILGEVDLSDPDPNPVDVFLFYSHPSIPDRIRFALTYDPWANGGHGEFVH